MTEEKKTATPEIVPDTPETLELKLVILNEQERRIRAELQLVGLQRGIVADQLNAMRPPPEPPEPPEDPDKKE